MKLELMALTVMEGIFFLVYVAMSHKFEIQKSESLLYNIFENNRQDIKNDF